MGLRNRVVRLFSELRRNKRLFKVFLVCSVILSSLISLHYVGARYSEHYSQMSNNVGNLITDYLVDADSYMYKKFNFKGELPKESMTEREIRDWNDDLYQQEMKIAVNSTSLVPTLDEYYKKREDAMILVQLKNSDLHNLIPTIKQFELVFNEKFKYPYVFLNVNEKYTGNFVKTIKQLLPHREYYLENIGTEHLSRPSFIDKEREKIGVDKLLTEGLIPTTALGLLKSIMRYMSYEVFVHPRVRHYKWYWRVEPGTNFFNDIDYDVFLYMENNDQTFGFTMATYEYDPLTVENLLPTAMKFLSQNNMKYLHANSSHGYLLENLVNANKSSVARGYSTCHFWSAFEIGNMDFFRGDAYRSYYEFLDLSGGFYYDRWGDGPVHSLGLSLLEDKNKIHWFKDIAFEQYPFFNCPPTPSENCIPGKFSEAEFLNLNCLPMWLKYS